MENGMVWDRSSFIELLSLGEEQIKKLEEHLGEPSQAESCKTLAQEIQFILKKAISLAKLDDPETGLEPVYTVGTADGSPHLASDSPKNDVCSNSDFKDLEHKGLCKKRKTLPKWTSQVRIRPGAAAEPPVDDGHSWRKYGQKEILGAKYPRGYYRCTYRNTQGCLAMKQLQRSSENPWIFDVTYRGEHTCLQKPKATPSGNPREPKPIHELEQQQQQQQQLQQDQSLLLSFKASLKVETDALSSNYRAPNSSPFPFPSSPVGCVAPESHIFSSPPTLENYFVESFSPTFVSPTASESNYCYSVSPFHTELISASASAPNSPAVDTDFLLGFDPNFELDASSFF